MPFLEGGVMTVGALAVLLPLSAIFLAHFTTALRRTHWRYFGGGVSGASEAFTVFAKGEKKVGVLESSASSVYQLSQDLAILFLCMLYVWMCERAPMHPHSEKEHNLDLLWFCFFMLFVAACFTIEKCKGGDGLLNRDQTEEWKGWMQIIFLLYHYFHASEVYNTVRVLISCYVWMTGFGNFSFFYIKADYGLVRFLQMMWRLNFLVTLLCLLMDNMYILYYICPLHTFYFLFTFATCRVCKNMNHTKYGARIKASVAAFVIFIVWEVPGVFDSVWFFLSNEPHPGAPVGAYGVRYEWHFRSGLDHWSTLFGIVFAIGFPQATFWIKAVEKLSWASQWTIKTIVGAFLLILSVWWYRNIFFLPKLEYNSVHPYTFFIPMLTYIYFRNICPLFRRYHLGLLASVGKVTLETYLMQHHIWLTSNAKTLLVFIPEWPTLNLLLTTCLYVFISRRLYKLTISLRARLIPLEPKAAALWVGIIAALLAASYGISWLIVWTSLSFASTVSIAFLFASLLLYASPTSVQCSDDRDEWFSARKGAGSRRLPVLMLAVSLLALISSAFVSHEKPFFAAVDFSSETAPTRDCESLILQGDWYSPPDSFCSTRYGKMVPDCEDLQTWRWPDMTRLERSVCKFGPDELSHKQALNAAKGMQFVFIGDETMQRVFYEIVKVLQPLQGHGDGSSLIQEEYRMPDIHASVKFYPAASPSGASAVISSKVSADSNVQVVIVGPGEQSNDEAGVQKLASALTQYTSSDDARIAILLKAPFIVESMLLQGNDLDNAKTANIVRKFNPLAKSHLENAVAATIPFARITKNRQSSSVDGIHYEKSVNLVAAQMILKYSGFKLPASSRKGYEADTSQSAQKGKGGGVAQSIPYGMAVLAVLFSMLLCFDNYGFISWISYRIVHGGVPPNLWYSSIAKLHADIGLLTSPVDDIQVATINDDKFSSKSSDNGRDLEAEELEPLVPEDGEE